jgi:glycosyltransferase involved in cell wall biosynthesis
VRVLHTIYDHPGNPWVGGGGAVRAHELSRRLVARGHEVTLLSGRYPGALDRVEGGVEVRFLGTGGRGYLASTFSFALAAMRHVLRHSREYDVVVEDFAPWNPVFTPLLSARPAVLHVNHRERGNILRRRGPAGLPFYLIEALYPRLFRHVTALSEWTRTKIGRPDAVVLPAGIPASLCEWSPAEGEARGGDLLDVLYVGRLEIQNKGLDTLIGAMRLLRPGVRLVLAGRGRDEGRLREMARGLDVDFRGFVSEDEKVRLLRRSAVFVLPSRFEGWGIALYEAAASAAPVVVSDIPELAVAEREGFGLRFAVGDPKALAARIGELLGDPGRRARMGERGRAHARLYTWERIALQYENYLRAVLREEGR